MYARILVAVDGSQASGRALAEAVRLTLDQRASLRIVHVVELQWLLSAELVDVSRVLDDLQAAAERTLSQAASAAAEGGLTPETGLLETDGGTVAHAVLEDALHWHADLIVLGTHGRHGLAHLVLGSVAEGVVQAARVPVLLLRGS